MLASRQIQTLSIKFWFLPCIGERTIVEERQSTVYSLQELCQNDDERIYHLLVRIDLYSIQIFSNAKQAIYVSKTQ